MSSPSADLKLSHLPASTRIPLWDIAVGDLLRWVADEVPDRVAITGVPTPEAPVPPSWTYRELLARSEDVARRLRADFRPGERIAVWAANKPEWVLLQMGAAMAGLVLVTLNPANRAEETRYLMRQSAASGLFLDRSFRQMDNEAIVRMLQPILPMLRTTVYFDQWEDYLAGPRREGPFPQVAPGDAALILFTSGTTGKPKGVVLTHRGIVNNPRYALDRYEIAKGAVWANILPYFHVGGSVTNTLGCLANRGTQVAMSEFNPGTMLAAIEKFRANIVMGVPIMAHAMLGHERFDQTDLSSLQLFLTGGTAVAPELVRLIRERFRTDVGVMFGQTEAGGTMCLTYRGDDEDHLCHTVGKPIESYELKIADGGTGQVLPIGRIGEICVRSPCAMKEYFDMPDKTAETLDAEGWVHTGDLGTMRPDGYVAITGRLKDMIIRGGENIYPREIEDMLATHPGVAQVAVFGVPDEKWGEQVAAAVIRRQGEQVDGEALARYLDNRIARHKIPKFWTFVTAFPTNPTGKIQKFVLRDRFAAEQDAAHQG